MSQHHNDYIPDFASWRWTDEEKKKVAEGLLRFFIKDAEKIRDDDGNL